MTSIVTTSNAITPEWVLVFRRKVWAFEIRFLEHERDMFQQMAYDRQKMVEEAYRKSEVPDHGLLDAKEK